MAFGTECGNLDDLTSFSEDIGSIKEYLKAHPDITYPKARREGIMTTFKLVATAAMGLEAIVAEEVKELGYETTTENGKVYFLREQVKS